MSGIFAECFSLKVIPDISNWNIKNTINIKGMFYECPLITKPDISK